METRDPPVIRTTWRYHTGKILAAAALTPFLVLAASRMDERDRAPSLHNRLLHITNVHAGNNWSFDGVDDQGAVTCIRLHGVAAPQSHVSDALASATNASAVPFLTEKLLGKEVLVVLPREANSEDTGCMPAYVYQDRNGPTINEQLIDKGLALPDAADHAFRARFQMAQKLAQRREN